MRITAAIVAVLCGCSFVGVRGAAETVDPASDPRSIRCTESQVLPTIDAIGGTGALVAAGAGVIIEQASDDGDLENFSLYYAGPLLAVAITYWVSASIGNKRITRCTELKEKASTMPVPVRAIDAPDQAIDKEDPNR
jgi:hypothetical protein